MTRTLYVAPVPPLNATAGTAYANLNTIADVSPAPQIVLPANLLDVGQVLRLKAFGVLSTTATPTIILGFYYGAVAGTALAASAAITTGSGVTNVPWELEYEGRVRSTGTAGTIMGRGTMQLGTSVSAITFNPIPATALATVTIDTTTAKQITTGATWSAASASNTLTCHHFGVELIG
jgi:hypothetical protein